MFAFLKRFVGSGVFIVIVIAPGGHILTACLAFGFFDGACNVDADADIHFRMQAHMDRMLPQRLNRLREQDLRARRCEAAFGDDFGDVARGHGAIEVAGRRSPDAAQQTAYRSV